jgi:hypothetical protein
VEDILTLLESVFGDSEKKARGNYRFNCPIPGCSSVRKRLEVLVETDENGDNPWRCWVCNKRGLSIRSLFRQANVHPRYRQRLNSIVNIRSSHQYHDEIVCLPPDIKYFDNIKPIDFVGRNALVYLKSRGLSKEDILKYQLGYCDSGKYSHRIIIPSFDRDGYLNYFVARSFIEDEEKRYDYPPVKRGNIIPFELYINWNAPIILCEGPFDMFAIMRNAIPLLEKGITQALLSKILGSEVDKVYIVLDKDGIKEALDHAEMIMSNGKTVYLIELEEKDPSKMGFKEFTKFIQNATALTNSELFSKKIIFKLLE